MLFDSDPTLNAKKAAKTANLDHPLRHWTQTLIKLTGISPEKHIKQAYKDLLNIVDKDLYNSKLVADNALFIA